MIRLLDSKVGSGAVQVVMIVPRFNAIGMSTDTCGDTKLQFSLSDSGRLVSVVLDDTDAAELMASWLRYARQLELPPEWWVAIQEIVEPSGCVAQSAETGDEARRSVVRYLHRWAETHESGSPLPPLVRAHLARELREAARAVAQGADRIQRVPLQPKDASDAD